MPSSNRPDPYNGFKNDTERRRALNTKERWKYTAAIASAAFAIHQDWDGILRWLMSLFH